MRTICLLITLVCLVTSSGVAQAAIYKWVDENGTITFRDTPPPEGVDVKVVKDNPLATVEYNSGLPPAEEAARKAKLVPVKEEPANTYPKVELYVTSWCGYCVKAKSFLKSKNIPFTVYDVDNNAQASRRHSQLNPSGGVPVAVIGGRTIRGFSPAVYAQALGL